VPPTKDLPSNEPEHVLVDGNCLDLRDNAGVPSDEKSGDDNTKDKERIRIDDPPLGEQQGDENENEDEDSDSDGDNEGSEERGDSMFD
jgi:hypothetical protein